MTKIHDGLNHPVIDAQCVKAKHSLSIRQSEGCVGIRATENPARDDRIGCRFYARLKAILNGYVYDTSFQLHHKKPGASPMQRDPQKVGGGGKTAQKAISPFMQLLWRKPYNGCLLPEEFSRYECGLIGRTAGKAWKD
jgi:hypothetical protein